MKNIKLYYWIITIIFLVLTIVFSSLVKDADRYSIILSGVSLISSCIALGLSDKKKNTFKGKVIVWSALKRKKSTEESTYYQISMRISNNSFDPIYDFIYRIRMPSSYCIWADIKNSNAREYRHGKSMIIIDDTYQFLGTKNEDGFIPIDFQMKIDNWIEGNIYLTISGINIHPVTYQITPRHRDLIKAATLANPIFLSTKMRY